MGGNGSGNWLSRSSKRTIESCMTVDVVQLMHQHKPRFVYPSGTMIWSSTWTGNALLTANYSVLPAGQELLLKLKYTLNENPVELSIRLTETYPHLGGQRWWFTCPLSVDNVLCSRRVRKLHLSTGAMYFGCRQCLNLTYRSCQQAHQYERSFGILAREMGYDSEIGESLVRE